MLLQQPRTAPAETLHRASAGQHTRQGLAPRDAPTAEGRSLRTDGHALSRGDGAAQRVARRRRRPVGTRSLLDRRTPAACLYPRRQGTEEESAAVDRMDVEEPEGGRLLRTGKRLRLRTGSAARQLSRLVAPHGGAEDNAAVLFRHAGQACRRFHDKIFPLPARHSALQTSRQLDVLGGIPRMRQPAGGVLALQHNGRRGAAQACLVAAFPGLRLHRNVLRRQRTDKHGRHPLRQSGAGTEGASDILPAVEGREISACREERTVRPAPFQRTAAGHVRRRRASPRQRAHTRLGAVFGSRDDVLAREDDGDNGRHVVRGSS